MEKREGLPPLKGRSSHLSLATTPTRLKISPKWIGTIELARKAGVTLQDIHIFKKVGILPLVARTERKLFFDRKTAVELVKRVHRLRSQGYTWTHVRAILKKETKGKDALLPIGLNELARRTGLAMDAIRRYQLIGLLSSVEASLLGAPRAGKNREKVFDPEKAIERVKRIGQLAAKGYTFFQMKTILEGKDLDASHPTLITSKELARRAKMDLQSLQRCVIAGLLIPAPHQGKHRLFETSALETLRQVHRMQAKGYNLKQIKYLWGKEEKGEGEPFPVGSAELARRSGEEIKFVKRAIQENILLPVPYQGGRLFFDGPSSMERLRQIKKLLAHGYSWPQIKIFLETGLTEGGSALPIRLKELARRTGLKEITVRFYERQGFLRDLEVEFSDPRSGKKVNCHLYEPVLAVQRVNQILECQRQGYRLSQIKKLMERAAKGGAKNEWK